MDELSSRLAEILNDPESMNRVREMAQGLFAGEEKNEPPPQNPFGNAADIQQIVSLVSRLKNQGDDHRTRLLEALKPNLSEPRQEKVDTAIKLIKIIDMLPTLSESGILNF